MTNPQTTPAPAPGAGPIATVANVGLSLFRLGANVVTFPLKTAGDLGVNLIRLGTNLLNVPVAVVAPQSRSEFASATNDVADAASRLYLSLINAFIGGIETVTRTVTTVTTEATQPTRK